MKVERVSGVTKNAKGEINQYDIITMKPEQALSLISKLSKALMMKDNNDAAVFANMKDGACITFFIDFDEEE